MEHVGDGLEKIVAGSLRQESSSEATVLAWPLACGHPVAQRTRALDCVHGILRVEVPDVGWRTELQALLPQYLNAITRYTGRSVRRIEFVLPAERGKALPR